MNTIDEVYQWFSDIATVGGFAYILVGFMAAHLVNWAWCKMRHKPFKVPWHYAGIAIGCVAIIITVLQSSQAYNTAKTTAMEVQQCQREFNTILRTRAKIAEENDNWSQIQRKALGDWLFEILYPPPNILQLRLENPNSPAYQQWAVDITSKYSRIIQQAQAEQDANLKERAEHPLPEPTCGK